MLSVVKQHQLMLPELQVIVESGRPIPKLGALLTKVSHFTVTSYATEWFLNEVEHFMVTSYATEWSLNEI